MEMCYDGALVMPSSYAVMSEDEMTYVEGGGTLTVTLTKGKIQGAIALVVGAVAGVAITAALDAIAVNIAAAIELGTAGAGTLAVGAFLVAWHGWAAGIAAGIAGSIIGSKVSKVYKGGDKTFKFTNKYIKSRKIKW